MKKIIATLGVLASLAATAAAHATLCSYSIEDCNGGLLSAEWSCQDCWPYGSPKLGTCTPVLTRRDPNDPESCVTKLTPTCTVCVYVASPK